MYYTKSAICWILLSFYVHWGSHLKSKNTELAPQTIYVILILSGLVYALSLMWNILDSPFSFLNKYSRLSSGTTSSRKDYPSFLKQPESFCASLASSNIIMIAFTTVYINYVFIFHVDIVCSSKPLSSLYAQGPAQCCPQDRYSRCLSNWNWTLLHCISIISPQFFFFLYATFLQKEEV